MARACLLLALFFLPAALPAQEPAPEAVDALAWKRDLADGVPFPVLGRPVGHTVEPGQYLYSIACKYNVAYPAIARANRLADPNRIIAGRQLQLPTVMIVPGAPAPGIRLLLNIPEQRLYLFRDGVPAGVYPVAVGLTSWQTPLGDFEVVNKVRDPAWHIPPGLARDRGLEAGRVVPSGPDNPLGDRWIGTSIGHTGFHGTSAPMSIGFPLSYGCVRLYPDDIAEVFELVAVGDRGAFIYEPFKATRLPGGRFWLEAHPDVYGRIGDIQAHALDRLAETFALAGPELARYLDLAKVAEVVREARGLPVDVTLEKPPAVERPAGGD